GEDNCGCIIVCKMPYLDLSDPQVKRKMESPGGGAWYALKTAQTLVQMCGRAVRSSTQRCDSYILDRQFSRLRSQLGAILPEWWLKAIKEKPVQSKSRGRRA
ncbi:MAG: helicase C-terminal domain-containing protein, partial [Kiritimatiellota bacterium]|nr:helicase C-terminal domain-containing protein [Kiritimatiellota bacterium]